jgi:hypothetical protein
MGKITDEALLVQLGYTQTHGMMDTLKQIIKNTHGYESIKKHLVTLQEALKPYGSFVAISSSHDFFKIKNETNSQEAHELIQKWSEKYKVNLMKVDGKEAYYVKGQLQTA